jgi:hypothetical protein
LYLNLDKSLYIESNRYNIPTIKPELSIDSYDFISFNKLKTEKKLQDKMIDFFLDDYQFERIWNTPDKYLSLLKQTKGMLSPDFSLYKDFPLAVQIFNHYRKHWLGRYYQDNGICVIPTISWSDEKSYKWCFDGEPKNSIVAVSNVGCMNCKESKDLFMKGYNKMLEVLNPKLVILFAQKLDNYKGNIHVVDVNRFKK